MVGSQGEVRLGQIGL